MTDTHPPRHTPELDALLSRTMRSRRLTAAQRERHLRRIGIAPGESITSASLIPPARSGVVATDGGQPVDNSPERRGSRRQWLELAAAVLAIAVVGGLLTLVFREMGSDRETRPGTAASPTAGMTDADEMQFAFVSNRDGNDEIYLYDAVTDELQRLTNDPAQDGMPHWSPDGSQLAFTRGPMDERDIYVMNADGSEQRNISRLPGDEINPSWSPDGQSIVFSHHQRPPELDAEVYVVALDGSAPRNLTNDPDSMDQAGPWSPDGSRLLYSRTGPTGMELAVMDADGSNTRTLATGGMAIFPGSWSPDGSMIGFSRLNDYWQGYVMNADGTGERLLVEGLSGHGPWWSPDGSHMVVTSREGDDMYLLDGNGTNPRPVEPPNGVNTSPIYRGFQWSSDNAWLYALIATGESADFTLVALAADDDDWTMVEKGIRLSTSTEGIAWRPDRTTDEQLEHDESGDDRGTRKSLLFVASHVSIDRGPYSSAMGRVRVYDAESGEERYAFDAGPRIDMALSPDGGRLIVAGSNSQAGTDDLVAYDPATGRELWRVAVDDRAWWKIGGGTSALVISPDGRELYVYSCSACTGELRMANGGDHWLQVFDMASGDKLRDVPVPTCAENRDAGVQLHISPDGRTLFVVCIDTGTVSAVDRTNGVVTEKLPGIGARIAGSASSPDARELFVLTYADGTYTVAVIDTVTHEVTRQRSMMNAPSTSRLLPLIALSNDGEHLIIGGDDRPNDTEAAAHTLYTFDPQTLQPKGEINPGVAIDAHPPVAVGDATVFVLGRELSPENTFRQSVLRITLDGAQGQIASFDREEVIVMRAGPVLTIP